MASFLRKHGGRISAGARGSTRPCLEPLEERLTPSTYLVTDASDTAGSANDVTLRYAMTQAITNSDPNAVIDFSSTLAGKTITLSTPESNSPYGPTAFVVSGANITIDASNAPGLVISGGNSLRPFAVTNTGSLTLEDLTVEDGLALGGAGGSSQYGGGGGAGLGGAVYDDGGTFTAEGVTFKNSSSPAYQAGISVSGITTDQRGYVRPTSGPSLGAFDPLATPFSPTPSPSSSNNNLSANVELLFLTEDQFALSVDSMISRFSNDPAMTQAADQMMIAYNNLLDLDNPALGSGVAGLEAAIEANPFYGSFWGYQAQGIGLAWAFNLDWAIGWFAFSASPTT
ncbi:MAG: choice-of-anchor Q domain-containing protein [Gemmataceae bacterium]